MLPEAPASRNLRSRFARSAKSRQALDKLHLPLQTKADHENMIGLFPGERAGTRVCREYQVQALGSWFLLFIYLDWPGDYAIPFFIFLAWPIDHAVPFFIFLAWPIDYPVRCVGVRNHCSCHDLLLSRARLCADTRSDSQADSRHAVLATTTFCISWRWTDTTAPQRLSEGREAPDEKKAQLRL